jgi:hypothetical protein
MRSERVKVLVLGHAGQSPLRPKTLLTRVICEKATAQTGLMDKDQKKVLVEWYRARDTLLGLNCARQDLALGLKLAQACPHPDAQWLYDTLSSGPMPLTWREAMELFTKARKQDKRSLSFAALVDQLDRPLIEAAALLFYPLAQGVVAAVMFQERSLALAEEKALFAAQQHDPQGMYVLAQCYAHSDDPVKKSRAGPLLLEAAELGFVAAQYRYGLSLQPRTLPERLMWIGRACCGCTEPQWSGFLEEMKNELVADVLNGSLLIEPPVGGGGFVHRGALFQIGSALRGRVDVAASTVFGLAVEAKDVDDLYRVELMYKYWKQKLREPLDYWSLVGARLKLTRELRIRIGQLVWDAGPTFALSKSQVTDLVQREWSRARDVFFDLTPREVAATNLSPAQRLQLGVQMAAACTHKQAQWLARLFGPAAPPRLRLEEERKWEPAYLRQKFAEFAMLHFDPLDGDNMQGMCHAFAALMGEVDVGRLTKAARLNDSLAQGLISETLDDDTKKIKYAKLAAQCRDARGHFVLGGLYEQRALADAPNAALNQQKAMDAFRHADWLGFVGARGRLRALRQSLQDATKRRKTK